MSKNIAAIIVILCCSFTSSLGQPFLLESTDTKHPFSLKIYYGTEGKGAFVQYKGQKGIIPLELKSYNTGSINGDNDQPDEDFYTWAEIVNGKISGTYSLRKGLRYIIDASYVRGRDNRKFVLASSEKQEKYDGVAKYLLHKNLITFNHYYNDTLIISYPNKTTSTHILPEIVQPNGARQAHIYDYNFDGYDDIAFSVSDAGMGVYQQYTIYLFNPKYQQFYPLEEPEYSAKNNCSCLCNVGIDKKKKELRTSCRGGARWWQDIWRYKNGKLVWVRSEVEPRIAE